MKKKNSILKFLFVWSIFLLGISTANAATNPYKPTSRFGPNCTWNAWNQTYKRLGIALPGWGNANTWYDYAKKAGFEVGSTPRANSIAVWEWNEYGHVAFVEEVKGDKIYIWESDTGCIDMENEELKNCIANGVSEETDRECVKKYGKVRGCEENADYWQIPGDLIGYIYLDKVPSKTTSSASTQKKYNNAYLSSVKITNVDFEFKKDVLEYELIVNSDIESIQIDATPEHKQSKVEGSGEHTLNVGVNTIKLVVTAEDNSKKTYTFQIKKNDNNAYLSSLTIRNINFSFEKDTFEYEAYVARDIESINVEGVAESELAQIDGLGEYVLNEEETLITISVKAEDGTKNEYKITLKKEQRIEENHEKKKMNIWIVIGGIFAFFAIVSIIILVKKYKSNKNKKMKSSE